MTQKEVEDAIIEIWNKHVYFKKRTYEDELNSQRFTQTTSDNISRWCQDIDDANLPKNGRSLWIIINDETKSFNSENIKLKENGSIWIQSCYPKDCPKDYLDRMLEHLIERHAIINKIDTNRIFLIAISPSCGEGVFQLAPRIADRLAAVGVMAGHPNDVSPLSLRNLPFALFMTGKNNSIQNKVASYTWAQSLQQCSIKQYHSGYYYWIQIGDINKIKEHMLTWMNRHVRNPWPEHVVWHYQGSTAYKRFYWLALPFPEKVKKGQIIIAEVIHRKNIYLELIPEGIKALTIRLSDSLVNLDKTITVSIYKEVRAVKIFRGIVPRTRKAIEQSIEERADSMDVATALLHIIWVSQIFLFTCLHIVCDINSFN